MAYDPNYHKEYYQKNKAKKIAVATKWQEDNKEQHNAAVARYAEKNPEVSQAAWKKYRETHKGTVDYIQKAMRTRAKARAAKAGYPFDITVEDIQNVWPEDNICPVLGIPFDLSGKNIQHCASLDKIIPELGYVLGNIIIISYRANSIKQDATTTELMRVAEYFSQLTNEHQEVTE